MNEPQKNKKMGWIIWGLVALIIAAIVVLSTLRKPEEAKPPAEEKAAAVRSMEVTPRSVPDWITLPGVLEPQAEYVLSSEQDARVTALHADKGDSVTNGQVLVQLDDALWQRALQRAAIDIQEAQKDLKRWTDLKKAGAVSVDDFEQVQTRKQYAEIAKQEAEIAIARSVVCAPADGIVNDRLVDVGEYVNKGNPVFVVVETRRLKLRVDVAERDVLSLQPGGQMTFRVPACGDRAFTGTVAFISQAAERQSKTFRTELMVCNDDQFLRAGMIAEVRLPRAYFDQAIVVPLAAVIPKKGEHVVFIEQNGRAVRRVVRIQALLESEAIIEDGLAPGERLIVEGHRTLQDGMKVAVTAPTEPTPAAAAAPTTDD